MISWQVRQTTSQSERLWREAGARSATELRAVLIAHMCMRMALTAVQAMARHRLARVPYVGVPRAVYPYHGTYLVVPGVLFRRTVCIYEYHN